MKFVRFVLVAIFFSACATQNTQNLSNPLNTLDSTYGIEPKSTFGTGFYGFMYMVKNVCGDSGDMEYEACENLLQSLCDEGDFKYCTTLGTMYIIGQPPDEVQKAKASALFKKACDGKNGSGCLSLGQIYEGENDFESKLEYAKYTRLACEYGDFEGCMNIALGNERIFKELKHTLEHNMVRDEAESKAIYATAKDAIKSALWGYERLVPLLQKECENAKKRIEIAKEAHKTLGDKFLSEHKAGRIDYNMLVKQTNKLRDKTYYEEFFESRYCKIYKDMKDGREIFEKDFEGF